MASSKDGALELRSLALPVLRIQATVTTNSPPHPSTPPMQTSATIPFRWEEKPGVPRRFTLGTVMLQDHHHQQQLPPKFLELPPCRVTPFTPSPTSVLDGPRAMGRPKFSSFRFLRYSLESGGSSRGSPSVGNEVFLGSLKVGKKNSGGGSFRFSSPSNSSRGHVISW